MYIKLFAIGTLGILGMFSLIGWSGQQPALRAPSQMKKFSREAAVQHRTGLVKVSANNPRPLERVVSALNEEYGWSVSFEDPQFVSDSELADDTDPNWQRAHPQGRKVRVPSGGVFEGEFVEDAGTRTPAGKEALLRQVAAAHNQSGNPGKFAVRVEDGRVEVVPVSVKNISGVDQEVLPVLDTLITIPAERRTALASILAITKEMSARTQVKIDLGMIPTNLLQTEVNVGGNNVAARKLLSQALNGTGRTLNWNLLYDANVPGYFLNLHVASVAVRDTYGRKTLMPVDTAPAH